MRPTHLLGAAIPKVRRSPKGVVPRVRKNGPTVIPFVALCENAVGQGGASMGVVRPRARLIGETRPINTPFGFDLLRINITAPPPFLSARPPVTTSLKPKQPAPPVEPSPPQLSSPLTAG